MRHAVSRPKKTAFNSKSKLGFEAICRSNAAQLALIMSYSREHFFPLKLTVAPFNFTQSMKGNAKWIHADPLCMQEASLGTSLIQPLDICWCGLMVPQSDGTMEAVQAPTFPSAAKQNPPFPLLMSSFRPGSLRTQRTAPLLRSTKEIYGFQFKPKNQQTVADLVDDDSFFGRNIYLNTEMRLRYMFTLISWQSESYAQREIKKKFSVTASVLSSQLIKHMPDILFSRNSGIWTLLCVPLRTGVTLLSSEGPHTVQPASTEYLASPNDRLLPSAPSCPTLSLPPSCHSLAALMKAIKTLKMYP